jgi:hypothetical protein
MNTSEPTGAVWSHVSRRTKRLGVGVHVEMVAACGIGHDRGRATVIMPTKFRG